MIQRFFLIILTINILAGCVTKQPPKFRFPADTRVAVVNHLEPFAIHHNYSALRYDSFSKNISVDWNIPTYIEKQLIQALHKDPRYKVVTVNPSEFKNQSSHTINQISMSMEIKPDVAAFLKSIANKHAADVIIVVKSYRGPGPFKIADSPIELNGYGLFTRKFVLFKKAYAYANIAVIVFKTKALTYLGSGRPNVKARPIENLSLAGDLKNLPPTEIDKARPKIENYANQAVMNAFNEANLIPAK